jgi:predicted 2-oxoglutarate/Fe(II)-dependent dioxygenase YbiX
MSLYHRDSVYRERVKAAGWLDGKLKSKPREPKPKPDPKVVARERAAAALKRWTTKRKRAETAIRKLQVKMRRQERALAQAPQPTA